MIKNYKKFDNLLEKVSTKEDIRRTFARANATETIQKVRELSCEEFLTFSESINNESKVYSNRQYEKMSTLLEDHDLKSCGYYPFFKKLENITDNYRNDINDLLGNIDKLVSEIITDKRDTIVKQVEGSNIPLIDQKIELINDNISKINKRISIELKAKLSSVAISKLLQIQNSINTKELINEFIDNPFVALPDLESSSQQ
jgi:hypothetical protein